MKKKSIHLSLVIVVISLVTACSGLGGTDEPVAGDFGPRYTPQQHQHRTLDALWGFLEENYIYFKSEHVNWDKLHEEYSSRIDEGLTDEEFNTLMHQLEGDLQDGAILFQSREERIASDVEDTSTYEGIGAFVGFQAQEVPHIVVLGVIAGSPAEKAGIRAHDSIFVIDGNPVLLEEGINVVKRVRGPAGSTVKLDIQTPGKSIRTIQVTRAQLISNGKLEARQIDVGGAPVGYILLPPISYDGMFDDVLANLQKFTTNQKLEGLILDLRVAGSGRGWPLEDLLSLFFQGSAGEFYDSAGHKQPLILKGADKFGSLSVPLVILVGQNTSGFPEIFAGSLQAAKRADLVGEITPGAIETTSGFYLPDGSRVYIETASFRLPNGEEIGTDGVRPEFLLEAGWDDVLPAADPVFEKAIELLKADQ